MVEGERIAVDGKNREAHNNEAVLCPSTLARRAGEEKCK